MTRKQAEQMINPVDVVRLFSMNDTRDVYSRLLLNLTMLIITDDSCDKKELTDITNELKNLLMELESLRTTLLLKGETVGLPLSPFDFDHPRDKVCV